MTPTKENTIIVGAIHESPATNEKFANENGSTKALPYRLLKNIVFGSREDIHWPLFQKNDVRWFLSILVGERLGAPEKTTEFPQSIGEQERHRLPRGSPRVIREYSFLFYLLFI